MGDRLERRGTGERGSRPSLESETVSARFDHGGGV